jgi:putative endopeptidase
MNSSCRAIQLFGVLVAVAAAGLLLGAADKAQVGEFGLDLAAMDRSVAPGDDFFRYMNAWR